MRREGNISPSAEQGSAGTARGGLELSKAAQGSAAGSPGRNRELAKGSTRPPGAATPPPQLELRKGRGQRGPHRPPAVLPAPHAATLQRRRGPFGYPNGQNRHGGTTYRPENFGKAAQPREWITLRGSDGTARRMMQVDADPAALAEAMAKARGRAKGGKYTSRKWNPRKNKGKGGWDYSYRHDGKKHARRRKKEAESRQLGLFGRPVAPEPAKEEPTARREEKPEAVIQPGAVATAVAHAVAPLDLPPAVKNAARRVAASIAHILAGALGQVFTVKVSNYRSQADRRWMKGAELKYRVTGKTTGQYGGLEVEPVEGTRGPKGTLHIRPASGGDVEKAAMLMLYAQDAIGGHTTGHPIDVLSVAEAPALGLETLEAEPGEPGPPAAKRESFEAQKRRGATHTWRDALSEDQARAVAKHPDAKYRTQDGTHERAMEHAEKLAERLRANGIKGAKAWGKKDVRVYVGRQYLAIGMDGTVKETQRGRQVFSLGGLYPSQRKGFQAARAAHRDWHLAAMANLRRERESNFETMPDSVAEVTEGRAAGAKEAREDHWTAEMLASYLRQVGAPINAFDAGHQEGLREQVAKNEAQGGPSDAGGIGRGDAPADPTREPGRGDLSAGEFAAIMGRSETTGRADERAIIQKLAEAVRAMAPQAAAIAAIRARGGDAFPTQELADKTREAAEGRIIREHGITDGRLLGWFWDAAERPSNFETMPEAEDARLAAEVEGRRAAAREDKPYRVFSTPGYRDPSAAHEKATKIRSQGGQSVRVDKKGAQWVVGYTAKGPLHAELAERPSNFETMPEAQRRDAAAVLETAGAPSALAEAFGPRVKSGFKTKKAASAYAKQVDKEGRRTAEPAFRAKDVRVEGKRGAWTVHYEAEAYDRPPPAVLPAPSAKITPEGMDAEAKALAAELGLEDRVTAHDGHDHALFGRSIIVSVRSEGKAIHDGRELLAKLRERWKVWGPVNYLEVRMGASAGGSSGYPDGTILSLVVRPDLERDSDLERPTLRPDAERGLAPGDRARGTALVERLESERSLTAEEAKARLAALLEGLTDDEKIQKMGSASVVDGKRVYSWWGWSDRQAHKAVADLIASGDLQAIYAAKLASNRSSNRAKARIKELTGKNRSRLYAGDEGYAEWARLSGIVGLFRGIQQSLIAALDRPPPVVEPEAVAESDEDFADRMEEDEDELADRAEAYGEPPPAEDDAPPGFYEAMGQPGANDPKPPGWDRMPSGGAGVDRGVTSGQSSIPRAKLLRELASWPAAIGYPLDRPGVREALAAGHIAGEEHRGELHGAYRTDKGSNWLAEQAEAKAADAKAVIEEAKAAAEAKLEDAKAVLEEAKPPVPKLKPIWEVVSADRDGKPTERYWKLDRIRWPGLVVWDHGKSGRGGRYEVSSISHGGVVEGQGFRFRNMRQVAEHLATVKVTREVAEAPASRVVSDPEQWPGAVAQRKEEDEYARRNRVRAAITQEDRGKYPADVIEEAEAIGFRPDKVLELRAMSEREEADYGRKMRRGMREEEAQYQREQMAPAQRRDAAAVAGGAAPKPSSSKSPYVRADEQIHRALRTTGKNTGDGGKVLEGGHAAIDSALADAKSAIDKLAATGEVNHLARLTTGLKSSRVGAGANGVVHKKIREHAEKALAGMQSGAAAKRLRESPKDAANAMALEPYTKAKELARDLRGGARGDHAKFEAVRSQLASQVATVQAAGALKGAQEYAKLVKRMGEMVSAIGKGADAHGKEVIASLAGLFDDAGRAVYRHYTEKPKAPAPMEQAQVKALHSVRRGQTIQVNGKARVVKNTVGGGRSVSAHDTGFQTTTVYFKDGSRVSLAHNSRVPLFGAGDEAGTPASVSIATAASRAKLTAKANQEANQAKAKARRAKEARYREVSQRASAKLKEKREQVETEAKLEALRRKTSKPKSAKERTVSMGFENEAFSLTPQARAESFGAFVPDPVDTQESMFGGKPAPKAPAEPATAEPDHRAVLGDDGLTDHQRERKEKKRRKATRLRAEAEGQWASSGAQVRHIPMGQPILMGHHSQRKHQRAIERAQSLSSKAAATFREAENAASSVESGNHVVSSDDPDAVSALKVKLAGLEAQRARIKAYNKGKKKDPNPWGHSETKREEGVLYRHPSYMLSNLGATIRNTKKRIEKLERAAALAPRPDIVGDGFTIEEDKEANRIRFHFHAGKPSKAIIQKMKRNGFRFSRREEAWQRHLNTQGRYATQQMAKEIFGYDPDAGKVSKSRRAAMDELRKAEEGPYIGKRGGFWKDARHTIPYKRRDHVARLKKREARHQKKSSKPSKKRSLVQRMFGKKPDAIDALSSLGHSQHAADLRSGTRHHERQLAQHGNHQLVATTPQGKVWGSRKHKDTDVHPRHRIDSLEALQVAPRILSRNR